jgi:hypothetical protein
MRHTLRNAFFLGLAWGCSSTTGGGGKGAVTIFVVAEDSIPRGLEPGADAENVKDGWTIRYQRFLVAIGNVKASRSAAPGETLADPTVFVLDLRNGPTDGYILRDFKDVTAARWDKVSFDIANAKPGARLLAPTTQADLDFMTSKGYSVYFEGTAEKDARKLGFKWGFRAGTTFADCASADGIPGFAVPAGGTIAVKPTLHGDHPFFTNVTQGAEITERRAAWLEICDRDRNLDVTLDELKACPAADAFPGKPSGPYDITGVRDQDGDGKITAYDYVDTQLRTLGDYQGDGECPTRTPAP